MKINDCFFSGDRVKAFIPAPEIPDIDLLGRIRCKMELDDSDDDDEGEEEEEED